MKIKPLFDRVVILPQSQTNTTTSGLVLAQNAQEVSQIGTIVAVGDGASFENTNSTLKVKVGDVVIYNKYAGTQLCIEQKNYIVMRQIDIIGVITNE